MLKKYLPNLNLLKLKRPQKPKQKQEEVLSPNLILSSDADALTQQLLPKVVVVTTYLSVFTLVSVVILFLINISLDKKLSTLLSERNRLLTDLQNMSQTESDLKQIVALTEKHKEINSTRFLLYPTTKLLIDSMPASMTLETISYTNGVYLLYTDSSSALDIARFISAVISDDQIASVAINAVSFSSRDRIFSSSLEVTVKR